jgi:hypothetical protein
MGECSARPFAHPPKDQEKRNRASPGESGESRRGRDLLALLKAIIERGKANARPERPPPRHWQEIEQEDDA